MDPALNPYSPGAGRRPGLLVGRDAELASWETRLSRVERGRDAQSAVLYGLRGVGKTVLLGEFARRAEARDWLVARLEMGTGKSFRESLSDALHAPLVDLLRPSAGARLMKALKTALSFRASVDPQGTWSFGVDLSGAEGGGADTGGLESDVLKLVRDLSAAMEHSGLAILVDEAQELTIDELTAISAAAHRASQDSWRLIVVLAGLPSLPRLLSESKSYTERLYTFADIRHLPQEVAREALTAPAREEGVEWMDDALAVVIQEAEGYPYFLQQFGQEVWNAATESPIDIASARLGVARGLHLLDTGFFRSRWDRASRAEKVYLRAMAEDHGAPSESGTVAARLGRKPTSLGPARASLIAKGLIYAPEHGVVAFTVPHMDTFIRRQP